MKSSENPKQRMKKRRNQVKASIVLFFMFLALISGYYWVLLFAWILLIFNDAFIADHIFYNPKSNYSYQLEPDENFPLLLEGNREAYLSSESLPHFSSSENSLNTWQLSLTITPRLSGRIYDPCVTIICGSYRNKQYFERGAGGRRYINLTSAIGKDVSKIEQIRLVFNHCRIKKQAVNLMRFDHPDFTQKRLLIIAPHADDAEIAAFGLYSQADTHIITLTAGEVSPKAFQHVHRDSEKASRLKGRLRAWDSIAVPLWGGVSQDRCINLGYFCSTLETMHDNGDAPVVSKSSGISDTRYFRRFNLRKLQSDSHGKATWPSLTGDLKELISEIKPEVIVMNDRVLDPHRDHIYANIAVNQALEQITWKPQYLLYYANHYKNTNMHPFGPAHSIAGLAPHFDGKTVSGKVCSLSYEEEIQKDKIYALEMMHDLKVRSRWKLKKKRREWIQRYFARRPQNKYGTHEYFRRAIRENELFFMEKTENLNSK